jgi:hypothetical protein
LKSAKFPRGINGKILHEYSLQTTKTIPPGVDGKFPCGFSRTLQQVFSLLKTFAITYFLVTNISNNVFPSW